MSKHIPNLHTAISSLEDLFKSSEIELLLTDKENLLSSIVLSSKMKDMLAQKFQSNIELLESEIKKHKTSDFAKSDDEKLNAFLVIENDKNQLSINKKFVEFFDEITDLPEDVNSEICFEDALEHIREIMKNNIVYMYDEEVLNSLVEKNPEIKVLIVDEILPLVEKHIESHNINSMKTMHKKGPDLCASMAFKQVGDLAFQNRMKRLLELV